MRNRAQLQRLICCFALLITLPSCATTRIDKFESGKETQLLDDEERLWNRSEELHEVLISSGYLYDDETLTAYINTVLDRLVKDIENGNNVDLKAYVLKDPFFNAFCLPNGNIYVHTSILASVDNEAQLAALLAHEAAHFICRHGIKSYRSVINKSDMMMFWNVTTAGIGFGLASLLGDYVILGSIYGYSREMEAEADDMAFLLVMKAGYDPAETKRFMETLYEATKEEKKIPYFYSSHPRTKQRIKTYEKLLSVCPAEQLNSLAGNNNKQGYEGMIGAVLLDNTELALKRENGLKMCRWQIERYISLFPDNARAYNILGRVCAAEGNTEEAKKALSKSIEIDAACALSYRDMGMIYYKNGERQQAVDLFKQYLTLAPEAVDAEYIRGYLNESKN